MGRSALLVAATLLTGVYAVGAFAPPSPDFDWSFGIEAYRAPGWPGLLPAGIVLFAVLLLPGAAERIGAIVCAAVERVPPRLRMPTFLAVNLATYGWVTDVTLSGDALEPLRRTIMGDVHTSNALTCWIYVGLAEALDLEALEVLRWVSCLSGVVYSWCAVRIAAESFRDGPRRAALAALLLTAGPVALFFGSLEVYAPLVAGTAAYLLAGLRWLRGRGAHFVPPLTLGVVFTLHGAAGLLGPSLLYLACRGRPGRTRIKTLVVWGFWLALPIAVVFASVFVFSWGAQLPGDHHARFGSFMGSAGETALLPLLRTPTNLTYRYALLEWEHLAGVASLVFLACPLAVFLVGSRRSEDVDPAAARFVAVAAGFLVVFPVFWTVSYGLRRDWDLFSVMGVALALLVGLRRLPADLGRRGAVTVTTLALFGFVPFVLTNAGGAAERRDYAWSVRWIYRRVKETDGHLLSSREYSRLADAVVRWDRELKRVDPTGINPRLDRAIRMRRRDDASRARAETIFTDVLAVEPRNPHALEQLGFIRLDQGNREEGERHLRAAIRNARENLRPPSRFRLATLAEEDGNPDEALRQLERLLSEDSEHRLAAAALERVAALRRARGDVEAADELDRRVRAARKKAPR